MPIAVVGANHRTASIELRERLAIDRADVPAALGRLQEVPEMQEAVLLSTCNRTELYFAASRDTESVKAIVGLLAEQAGLSPERMSPLLYVHRDRAAAEHLFRVTAGLDSMVLGEAQIQGQVKEAYAGAREVVGPRGTVVGSALNRLFQSALAVGGRVRSETEIGLGAASVSSAAVDLVKKIFGSLRDRRALVLGAGEMGELTLECLQAEGVRSPVVVNRTYERACELAERWGGRAVRLEEFGTVLAGVDIVICSTAASRPVLTLEHFRRSLPHGRTRPLCIIDIAIPRDVETRVGDEPNVFLYNIDDLHQIVDDNLDRRREELPRAEAIIEEAVEDYWDWFSGLAVVPTIRDLRSRGERMRQSEVERALRRLRHLSEEDQGAIEALTRALTNKLLHAPTVRLRQAAGNGRGTAVLDTVRYLFELDDRPDDG